MIWFEVSQDLHSSSYAYIYTYRGTQVGYENVYKIYFIPCLVGRFGQHAHVHKEVSTDSVSHRPWLGFCNQLHVSSVKVLTYLSKCRTLCPTREHAAAMTDSVRPGNKWKRHVSSQNLIKSPAHTPFWQVTKGFSLLPDVASRPLHSQLHVTPGETAKVLFKEKY